MKTPFINDFKHLLSREQAFRHERGLSPSPSYDQLPAGLMEKLNRLENFDFSDNDSRQLFGHWQNRQADILDLYEFYSEYAHQFTGQQAVDFDQALELMRLFQSIEEMQQQIMTGQFSAIDPQTLKEILGENAAKSFNILIELPQMMAEEGIVEPLREGFKMTPRGMRALGELAFGKIYHHINRDRPGGHAGNAPQSGEIEPDSSRPYQYGDRFDLDITKTVLKVTAQGMNIETFMLDDNPVLVELTRELTRINGGRAVMCLPGELGKLILIEEIRRRGRA